MSARAARRLGLGLLLLTAALIVAGEVLALGSPSDSFIFELFVIGIGIAFSLVGFMIATRQPGNAIGWIFMAAGVSAGLAIFSGGYADHWLDGEGSRAVGEAAAVYATASWIPFVLLPGTFLLLLFPDGHVPSSRWRTVAWIAGAGIAGVFLSTVLKPGPLEDYPQLINPYGVEASLVEAIEGLSFLATVVGLIGSAASLVVRYRRSTGIERQQIRWLALAGALAAVTVPVNIFASDETGLSYIPIMLSVLCLPVAAGIAMLRYRLYDIDVVINRTLVYGALTATLAAVYIGTVLLLQLALDGVTSGSDLAVAGSTLAAAAIFRPARGRIQQVVDRRFFRRRYDAARTLESFSSRLRDQVDLGALEAELRGVVAETVQPSHVSIWLREGTR